ncbi:MAG: 3-phosphoshikimate 1-carboxyvinyltransferase [Actinobacteria bacterium]|nr:3-phosphoshikimate 1-carboxyvinyltransferase [Actinomycetota bacterium]
MVPADKSISHRAAMIAAICESAVQIEYFLEADDTLATLGAIEACGVSAERQGPGRYLIQGQGLRGLAAPGAPIYIGNSGTSMRLLPGIFAGQQGCFVLDGDSSIRRRPMDRIVAPLRSMGVDIQAENDGVYAPLKVCGGAVAAIDYRLPVASAQVKSAVLLAGLFAGGPTTVTEPAICRDHTERMLQQAGAVVSREGLRTTIQPATTLALDRVVVPGDFSSAAFFIVAATVVPGSRVTLTRVGVNDTRTGLLDIMEKMGADITISNRTNIDGEPDADIEVRQAPLTGVEVAGDITGRAIDELPLVALLGAVAQGDTVVRGAAELKLKESDRIGGLVANMRAMGVDIEALADGFVVHGGSGAGVTGGVFKSSGDHRMAMLGAVAGLVSRAGVAVDDFACAAVSYPAFIADLQRLGGEVEP